MKNPISYLLCFVLLFLHKAPILAQCAEPQAVAYLQGNDVQAAFRNAGDMFWDGANAQYEVTLDQGLTNINTIFAGALWMGAYGLDGYIRTACQTYRQQGTDFWAGPLDDITGVDIDCAGYDRIWKVSGTAVRSFLTDFYDNGVLDNPIDTAILAWPARGNANSLAHNNLVLPNQDLAPFFDRNADNIYDPYNGDYPVADPNYPSVIAEDLLWMVFNDFGNIHAATSGTPLGVEVQLTAFAFQCAADDLLNKTIFTRHKIINKRHQLFDLKVGFWTDFDLGCMSDDYIGTVPAMNSIYAYNSDNDDDVQCGLATGYGTNPPVQALTILNQTMTSANAYANQGTGEPTSPAAFYQLLSGQFADGTPITTGGTGYNPNNPLAVPTPYVFPDNPNTAAGWSMLSAILPGLDQRSIIATSKNGLMNLESFEISAAYSLHQHADSNYLQNVNLMYQQIPMLQNFYDNGYNNGSCSFVLPIQQIPTVYIANPVKIYPNPAQDILTVESTDSPLEFIEIYSLLGELVHVEKNINFPSIQLSVKNLPSGFYFLKIKSGTQVWSEKMKKM